MVMVHQPQSEAHKIPEGAILIIGAGHFGGRAARILCKENEAPVIVVDFDEGNLSKLDDLPVTKISYDGIDYLVEVFDFLRSDQLIVPACPVHLACEWLGRRLEATWEVRKIDVPEALFERLPNPWHGGEGSLLVSYADFVCPDDCPEPEYCTVTGEKRDVPLYELIEGLNLEGFGVHVIRSRQLGPGLGGYTSADLADMEEVLVQGGRGSWLVATSCRCHGIITALDMIPL